MFVSVLLLQGGDYMSDESTSTLKTHGFGLSGVSIFYISIIYIVSMWVWLLLLIPLAHFFSPIKDNDWIVAFPCLLILALMMLHLLSSFYTVTLTEGMVVLSWLHIPLRRIPVDTLRLFCAVGNEREDALCLTTHTIEDMALLEEQHLLRNFFTKYDVPFLKKKADWQDTLAKRYLNRMRRSPRGIFRDKKTLFMTMDPVAQHQIHKLYTHLPYKNYTDITGYKTNPYFDNTKAPCLWMPTAPCSVEVREDAVVLYTKKEEKRRIPLRNIKTIVRVDIFRSYNKHFPHHLPVLFLSVRSVEEMSREVVKSEDNQLLQVYRYATKEAMRWSVKKDDCCNLPYTPELVSRLQALCPDAQWVDISNGWIFDTP